MWVYGVSWGQNLVFVELNHPMSHLLECILKLKMVLFSFLNYSKFNLDECFDCCLQRIISFLQKSLHHVTATLTIHLGRYLLFYYIRQCYYFVLHCFVEIIRFNAAWLMEVVIKSFVDVS